MGTVETCHESVYVQPWALGIVPFPATLVVVTRDLCRAINSIG